MPVYPGRRKGTWRVTVYADSQHEKILECPYREAKAYEARKLLELRGSPKGRASPSFAAFCEERYEPHAEKRLASSTWQTEVFTVATLVKHFGKTRLHRISAEQVQSYQNKRREKGVEPSTINKETTRLVAILRWARDVCNLPAVVPTFARLEVGKKKARAWSSAEVRQLYAGANAIMSSMLHFMLETGCRKGELVAALWTWIDWDRRMLRIPISSEWQPKDREERFVPLSDALLATLRDRPRVGPAIFCSARRRAYRSFPHHYWKEMLAASGMTGHPHMTRHTYASHFLKAQPDLFLLADVMGHSTTYVTERYSHMLPEHLERARNAVSLAPPGEKTLAATLAVVR